MPFGTKVQSMSVIDWKSWKEDPPLSDIFPKSPDTRKYEPAHLLSLFGSPCPEGCPCPLPPCNVMVWQWAAASYNMPPHRTGGKGQGSSGTLQHPASFSALPHRRGVVGSDFALHTATLQGCSGGFFFLFFRLSLGLQVWI